MSDLKNKKTDGFDLFLRNNAPQPPAPSAAEQDRILRTIMLTQKSPVTKTGFFTNLSLSFKWLIPAACTALIALVVVTHHYFSNQNTIIVDAQQTQVSEELEALEELYAFQIDEEDDADDENFVGNQYYYLASAIYDSE